MKSSPRLHQVHRRPFGIGPVPLLGGLGAVVLLAAIVLFAVGSWIVALLFLAVAVGLTALLLVALEREPDAKSARAAVRAADQARWLARLSAITISVWSHAGLELARIRRRAEVLKAQASDLSEAVHAADAQAAKVVGAARERLERERSELG